MSVGKFLLKGFGALPRQWRNSLARLRWQHPVLNQAISFAACSIRNCDLEIQEGIGEGLRFNCGNSASSFVVGSWQVGEQGALRAMLS